MDIVKFCEKVSRALPNARFFPVGGGIIKAYDSRYKLDVPDKDQPDCEIGHLDTCRGVFVMRKDYEHYGKIKMDCRTEAV